MRSALAGVLTAALVFVGCSAATGDGADGAAAGSELWRTAAMRDVVTGEEFRIADLEGKVVAIEAMAIWCSTCRTEQLEAQAALDTLGSSDVAYISLDVDPNERPDDLAEYARREGFDWRFAVASPDVSRALVATFGDHILSPPSTPLVILDPQGEVVEQHVGVKGARALVALFQEHLP